MTHDIALSGCRPEPLMSYLKALGVLRILSEQKDENARGWWQADVFWLRTGALSGARTEQEDREILLQFFLNEYKPTAIVAPWGARSGLFSGSSERSAREALNTILATKHERFDRFRQTIISARNLLQELKLDTKAEGEEKLELLRVCRSRFPEDCLDWIDACYVLTADDRKFPPLLGTGGNEGSGSYVSGFAQQVVECLIRRNYDHSLAAALFGESLAGVTCAQSPGHFSSTAAGGANAGQGPEASPRTNPWDYLLCLEGTCVWASGVARRLGEQRRSMAAFPFTVNVSGAGDPGVVLGDEFKPKQAKRSVAETWLPLWRRPTVFLEIKTLIAEGKTSTSEQAVASGFDFARAVATLSVDRGIDSFQRTIFLMRNGQNFLNISLGRFQVRERKDLDLLREIDPWLDSFRRAVGDKAPPRFRMALQRIDEAVFDACRYGDQRRFTEILCALGNAERQCSNAERWRSEKHVPPLSGMSTQWMATANDDTVEFEIALALSGIHDAEDKISPLRANLEPISIGFHREGRARLAWAEQSGSTFWNAADLNANLAAVLERRMLDGKRANCSNLPLDFRRGASIDAVATFLAGPADAARETRITELLWGLILVSHDEPYPEIGFAKRLQSIPLPRAYALLKLLFLPKPLVIERTISNERRIRFARRHESGIQIPPEPRVLALLRAGRLDQACRIAAWRLRSGGLPPMPIDWGEVGGIDGLRLAAALLIPTGEGSLHTLVDLVSRSEATTAIMIG